MRDEPPATRGGRPQGAQRESEAEGQSGGGALAALRAVPPTRSQEQGASAQEGDAGVLVGRRLDSLCCCRRRHRRILATLPHGERGAQERRGGAGAGRCHVVGGGAHGRQRRGQDRNRGERARGAAGQGGCERRRRRQRQLGRGGQ